MRLYVCHRAVNRRAPAKPLPINGAALWATGASGALSICLSCLLRACCGGERSVFHVVGRSFLVLVQ